MKVCNAQGGGYCLSVKGKGRLNFASEILVSQELPANLGKNPGCFFHL